MTDPVQALLDDYRRERAQSPASIDRLLGQAIARANGETPPQPPAAALGIPRLVRTLVAGSAAAAIAVLAWGTGELSDPSRVAAPAIRASTAESGPDPRAKLTVLPPPPAPPRDPRRPGPVPVARSAEGPTGADANPVTYELALLAAAREAIRGGRHGVALRKLDAHARRYPSSLFAQERRASRVTVLCALGRHADALRAGQAYARAHPDSRLADELRNGCKEPGADHAQSPGVRP